MDSFDVQDVRSETPIGAAIPALEVVAPYEASVVLCGGSIPVEWAQVA